MMKKREWERAGIGTGVRVSTFVDWGVEPDGRRLTSPRRERLRENEKIIAISKSICSTRHVLFSL